MSRPTIKTTADLQRELNRLRMRIDLLPPEQRPHLYELADTILVEHRRLTAQGDCQHDAK